ncbi:MAG: carboxypeptidase regulatory-like domain-containing protein [Muribaculaceae bacterium]|nr:carboxypeptidase regulatory-like domain-containing protein [Muribaculaceae bacterium]
MKQLIIIFVFLLGICAASSCSSDISEENKYGSIAGSVSDATTGEPVPTVRVKLTPGGNSTVTGTDGSFNFLNLEPAEYTLDISKEGYKANSAKVNVRIGAPTSAHLLIERIPSIVTADRETLDFGDNQSLNTLSFNIVNSGYEKLKWEIEEHCEWITEINPSSGELDYGKTAGIVVVIDRELLNAGENKAVIVIKSSDGSSEMNVVAIGEGRALPALNTLDATDVTSTSATLNGEISFEGSPVYTERGFVYSNTAEPTLENTISKLSCKVTDEKEFSYKLTGLDYGKVFHVRAYATNKLGTAYSANEIIFKTEATLPALMALDATNVTPTSATFNGEITEVGTPSYTERGFVYSLSPTPTLDNTLEKITCPVNTNAKFSHNVSGLEYNKTYYLRAYAVSEMGTVYSTNEISFKTTATLPSLKALEATNVTPSSATINAEIVEAGNPTYTERGFVYSLSPTPTLENTIAKIKCAKNSENKFSHNLSSLEYNKTYYVRAYAVSDVGTVYSTNEISFTTTASLPALKVMDATNVTPSSATFNGEITEKGNPAYNERGFVYSLNPTPTIDNTIAKITCSVSAENKFSRNVSDLEFNKTYYLRGYAVSDVGTVYSTNEISFKTTAIMPEVSTLDIDNADLSAGTATFRGKISNIGNPAYTERGFVYGTMPEPTIYDNKVVANGAGELGNFSKYVTDLPKNTYYVRAYATTPAGTTYGEEKEVSLPWVEIPAAGIAVQKEDLGIGYISTAIAMCENSTLGGYTDWRLPTKDELMVLYNNREKIGGFGSIYYWSGTRDSNGYYYEINFATGALGSSGGGSYQQGIRAVRTLNNE